MKVVFFRHDLIIFNFTKTLLFKRFMAEWSAVDGGLEFYFFMHIDNRANSAGVPGENR